MTTNQEGRRALEAADQQGLGVWTRTPLDASRLMHDPREPALDPLVVRTALELAATAYDLETTPWEQAGWTDMSAQVDRKLYGASEDEPEQKAGILHRLYGGLAKPLGKRREERGAIARAREDLRKPGVLSQLIAALSAQKRADTGKVLVMARQAAPGRHVIALGFMGTGKRILDWAANFRMSAEEGMHKGFLHLTRQFERNAGRILLPDTARALNLPRLTLAEVLEDIRGADTPFRLFLAGHSQGAAVMQIWTHRRMEEGCDAKHIAGYGFASPTVAIASDAGARGYPLVHLINTDDYMPRVGARTHLGACYYYEPTSGFRSLHYNLNNDDDARLARSSVESLMRLVRGTESCMLFFAALMRALRGLPDDALGELFAVLSIHLPGRVLSAADVRVRGFMQSMETRLRNEYRARVGVPMPGKRVRALSADMARDMGRLGISAWARAFMTLLGAPHTLVRKKGLGDAPYTAIAADGLSRLLTESEATLALFAPTAMLYAVRRAPAPRRTPGRGKWRPPSRKPRRSS